jgi:hypothetical protein
MAQERPARIFLSGKGAKSQEYFVYFKILQRSPGKKFPLSAAVAIVRWCPHV